MTCQRKSYRISFPRAAETRGFAQDLVLEPVAGSYSSGAPCGTERKGCPVQLFTKDNKHYLRFCIRAGNGKPGWMVPIASADQAMKIADAACAAWRADKRRFKPSNPAVVAAMAARAGIGPDAALGRLRRRR